MDLKFEYCGEEKHLLPLPEIEPRFLGGSDCCCTDRANPEPVFWLEKIFLSSFSSSELAQAAMLLTFV
jgi:hypothetical protein